MARAGTVLDLKSRLAELPTMAAVGMNALASDVFRRRDRLSFFGSSYGLG